MAKRKALEVEDVTEVEAQEESKLTLDAGLVITTFLSLLVGIFLSWWVLKEHFGAGPFG